MSEPAEPIVTEYDSDGLYPFLPLRDIVVFPHMVIPLFVGRPKSIKALEEAMAKNRLVFLAAQKDAKVDEPGVDDVYPVGTISQVIQVLKLPDGTVKALVEGKRRGRIVSFHDREEGFYVECDPFVDSGLSTSEVVALKRGVTDAFETYVSLSKKVPPELMSSLSGIADADRFADTVSAHLNITVGDKQELLSVVDSRQRLETLLMIIERENEILQIEQKIRSRVKSQMERHQKEHYLNEQMRAIQKELGEKDEFKQELRELETKLETLKLPKEAKEKAQAELRKLKMMSPMSAEATVVRNYLDWIVSLPWTKGTRDRIDIERAEAILNADHFGLEKVKERILEYLAVRAMVKRIKGPILCLVGPPGVGKTSLGRSIAESMKRKFTRISLGGVRDEAEIRGHRRTYIGAMPGKIVQGMRKVGVRNPVFLLDEIDKMSADFRGDPSSAMLEVLDPEQNATFGDHFLDLDYDLSEVLFIATANSLHTIPKPLLDRMEVIRIEGYTEAEKYQISRRYLISKQLEAHGLTDEHLLFSDEALFEVIRRYTKEAGVRSLDREIASLCRKAAREIVARKGSDGQIIVDQERVRQYLGVPRFTYGSQESENLVGVVNGLAWTEVGGDTLMIEVSVLPGNGKLTITGKLGEVMRESAQAAMSYIRSRSASLGLEADFYTKVDVHIHVPEGAIPKDGPSAGITMAVAIASALTGRPIDRNIAMTGEITLRGRVLPIGGVKEKLLAARRGGMNRILIPEENRKDLEEIPAEITDGAEIICVSHMDSVLQETIQLDAIPPFADTVPQSDGTRERSIHH